MPSTSSTIVRPAPPSSSPFRSCAGDRLRGVNYSRTTCIQSERPKGREFRIESLDGERLQSDEFLRSPAPLSASRQKWTVRRGNTRAVAVGRRRIDFR
jgi:hypothetical protein